MAGRDAQGVHECMCVNAVECLGMRRAAKCGTNCHALVSMCGSDIVCVCADEKNGKGRGTAGTFPSFGPTRRTFHPHNCKNKEKRAFFFYKSAFSVAEVQESHRVPVGLTSISVLN